MYSQVVVQRSRVSNAEILSQEFKPENFTNHVLPTSWKTLEVRDLNFSYDDEAVSPHLHKINLTIIRGARIALVGESGSGKTTLLKIMRNLYEPETLQLFVDTVPIIDGFGGICRAITLIPQNPEIFKTTIYENITLGADHEIHFVTKFTDMACFSDVAEALPNKFDSSVKEKGVNLSGGQQQRLALSRGLLAGFDKDIVLLDEPTSSLDTSTEMKVYQNIFREFKGKTIISSIHRLHLLPMFDVIYLFDQGKIQASGSCKELLVSSLKFQELWAQYAQLE